MPAAIKSKGTVPDQRRRSRREPRSAATVMPLGPQRRPQRGYLRRQGAPILTTIEALPRPRSPLWLKALMGGQALSVVMAAGLVGATFVAYGMTVRADRQLGATTRYLQQLQRQEQQLTTGKAVLKHHLAQQVTSGSLTAQTGGVIFLEPDAVPEEPATSRTPPSRATSPIPLRPLGY
ncbi:hypothetical protein [Leptolyngbya sp. PCC 6406]|uniref:hypothetical protein n=1 Tax=Leptolyngbya sp. PCC 6406 TaxID=1173264 RepID=UPI0002AD1035|nr:hypothetical protein [Leptolyngbya sp. PCC 6406]